jgi:PAS domain S-box-containing protein
MTTRDHAARISSGLSLSPELLAKLEEKVASGRYRSVEEVVAAGLRGLDSTPENRWTNEAYLAATLHEAEERLRVLSDHLPGGMIYQVVVDRDGNRRFQYVSAGVENLFGISPDAAIENPTLLYGAIVEEDRARVAEGEAEVLRSHSAFNVEVRVRHTSGEVRWVRLASAARALPDGGTIWDGFAIDITARRRSETAFRESEARFRHMADSAPALIWMTDADGQIIFANMHYDHLFGRPAADMLGDGWREIIHPEDVEDYEAAFREAFAERRPFKREVRVFDKDRRVRWLQCDGVPRLDDAGSFLGYTGCNMDITDVRLAQERQTLLINELNHRVKNTLATVQSVAMQTLRNAVTTEQARDDFEMRLIALSRAHDVLTRENWDGANLHEIVDQAIEPYRRAEENRFKIRGSAVRLTPRMALALAMALQELATNAIKYGALSNATGRVEIAWKLDRSAAEPRLRLRWSEAGGPAVEAPRRRGFGSRLIERSLARDLNGEVALAFEPAGLVCTVDAPIQKA